MCVQCVIISTSIAAWVHSNASIAFRVSFEILTDPIWLGFWTETTILFCDRKTLEYYTSVVEPTEEGTKKMTTRRSLEGILGGDMRMRGKRRLVATVEGSMARRKQEEETWWWWDRGWWYWGLPEAGTGFHEQKGWGRVRVSWVITWSLQKGFLRKRRSGVINLLPCHGSGRTCLCSISPLSYLIFASCGIFNSFQSMTMIWCND